MSSKTITMKGHEISISGDSSFAVTFQKSKQDQRLLTVSYERKELYLQTIDKSHVVYKLTLYICNWLSDKEYAQICTDYELPYTAEELKLNSKLSKRDLLEPTTTIYFSESTDRFLCLFLNEGEYGKSKSVEHCDEKYEKPSKAYFIKKEDFDVSQVISLADDIKEGKLPSYPLIMVDVSHDKMGDLICNAHVMKIEDITRAIDEVIEEKGKEFLNKIFDIKENKKELLN